VTEGLFTFVAIDDQARPRPVVGGSQAAAKSIVEG
jgi:acyl-CoA hydrolase